MINNLVPKIRFEGFHDEWKITRLGTVLQSLHNGQTPSRSKPNYWGGTLNWLTSGELNRNTVFDTHEKITPEGKKSANLKIVPKGTVVIAITGLEAAGTRGSCAKLGMDTTINQSCMALIPDRELLNSSFLFQWYLKIGNEYGEKYTQGTKQQSYNAELIKKLPINLPCVKEQEQIADFIGELGNRIALQQSQIELLKESKQGFLQKMFPKDGERVPEVRFDGFRGEWDQRELGEISIKVTEKNKDRKYLETLTNSASLGVISQAEYFDKKISNDANIDGYYVVSPNDFVYNPRISKYAPVGPIKRNKLNRTGIMSPLYYVFSVKGIDEVFIEKYFETVYWHKFMKLNGDSGARSDRFAIKDSVFKLMPIPYPSIEEQQKIGEFFKKLDDSIATHEKELELLKETKKGFLQKMFV